MKRFLWILLCLLPSALFAQQAEDADTLGSTDEIASELQVYPEKDNFLFDVFVPTSSLSLPYVYYRPWETWSLHEGLNARFSFGMAAGLGKGSPKGVGLEERIDLAYAGRWGSRWSYAFMVQGTNATWGPVRNRDISLSGIVGYRASERFNLYVYFSKSIMHDGEGFMDYYTPMGQPSVDRVGVVADWTIGENAWLQIAVEASRIKFENPFCNLHQLYGPPPMRSVYW
ncbi:MAG: hypothetical protein IKI05_04595 [Bacteroidaceae bacterium]|nr:hypothetical protein [Bacteroidaceae bacterium]